VRGRLTPTGWGVALGFPAFTPDPTSGPVGVKLLHSTDLPQHWPRLDEFEGGGYRRLLVPVACPDGRTVTANMYAAADPPARLAP